jgi:hypothetical protein
MLDSRRDRRYRSGAHRSIGVGLREVTFHDMPGASSGVPGFPLSYSPNLLGRRIPRSPDAGSCKARTYGSRNARWLRFPILTH